MSKPCSRPSEYVEAMLDVRVYHGNNRSGEAIEWQKCGYESHADYNASKNIGLQYLRRR